MAAPLARSHADPGFPRDSFKVAFKWRFGFAIETTGGVGPLSRWGSSDDPQPSGISPPIGSSDREQGEAEDGRSRLRTVPPR